MTTKAITICQPYPELILRGEKRVENRSWYTPYRGRFLIHAGKSRAWLQPGDLTRFGRELAFGAIVGEATLIDCLHINDLLNGSAVHKRYPWLKGHEHAIGPWLWILADVSRAKTETIVNGKQGWWTFTEAAAEKSYRAAVLEDTRPIIAAPGPRMTKRMEDKIFGK